MTSILKSLTHVPRLLPQLPPERTNMIITTSKHYSPKTLQEFIFPNDEVRELVMAYASGELEAPLLLYGASGTGKTAIQKLLPDALEKKPTQVSNVKCADLETASDIHDLYGRNKQFNRLFTVNGQRYNYFIIEEFLMTKKALIDAMKLELEATLGTDMTILSTNHIDKVDSGIISRCEVLHVPPCSPALFLPHAKMILDDVGVDVDEQKLLDRLNVVYELYGDNRKYYSALDHMIRNA